MEMKHGQQVQKNTANKMMYKKLALMIVLSFIFMYMLMYAMVDSFSNVIPNANQFYMAGLMTMPMIIIELSVMGSMYLKKKLNVTIIIAGIIGLIVFYFSIRQQAGIGDKEFLKQ